VANKFPIVSSQSPRDHGPFFQAADVRGHQEVIVESPRHDAALETMSEEEVLAVLLSYLARHKALMAEDAIQAVSIFRNRGSVAGASLQHPHSQIVALETCPPLIRKRQAVMASYYLEEKRCVVCDLIARELRDGSRAVSENSAFVTVVPFAASAPYEMWILPRAHYASFGETDEGTATLLAAALRSALAPLVEALGGPPYNLVIDTATKDALGAPHVHWLLRIVPQLTVPGGFELSSGLSINPHLPEEDAAFLRKAGKRATMA
jgi:UDPglucose--hexose-1-phosphate uridylyltransferase